MINVKIINLTIGKLILVCKVTCTQYNQAVTVDDVAD